MSEQEQVIGTAEAPHNTHPVGYNEHCPECLRLENATGTEVPANQPAEPAPEVTTPVVDTAPVEGTVPASPDQGEAPTV